MKYLARALKVACWLGLIAFLFSSPNAYLLEDEHGMRIFILFFFCCAGAVLHGLNIWDCFDK